MAVENESTNRGTIEPLLGIILHLMLSNDLAEVDVPLAKYSSGEYLLEIHMKEDGAIINCKIERVADGRQRVN